MKKCELCGKSYDDYFVACPECVLGRSNKSNTQNISNNTSKLLNLSQLHYLLIALSACTFAAIIWKAEILIVAIPCAAIYLVINSKFTIRKKTLITTSMSIIFVLIVFGLTILIGIGEAWSGQGSSHGLPELLIIIFLIFIVFVVAKLIADNDKNI